MPVCYANPAPIYQPAMRIVSAISKGYPAQVTTSFDHDYHDGAIVRLNIPPHYGMQQANQLQGAILVTSSTTFLISIDTTQFDAFSQPVGAKQCANVTPVGEISSTLASAVVNVLPFPALP